MLHFSFSTVLMAFLASIVAAGFVSLVFSDGNTMACIGYRCLMLFVGIALVRLLFPFELPFTVTVFLPETVSKVIRFIRHSRFYIADIRISLWTVFELIWVFGIIVKLFRFIRSNHETKDYILKYGKDKTADDLYMGIMDRICQQYHIKNTFRIMESAVTNMPIISGWKNPCIILPDNLSLSSDMLYYVLSHEVLHHLHHSFLIKECLQLLTIVYWWNPACSILYRHSDTLLEMYVDGAVTKKNAEITAQYAECLLYMKKVAVKRSAELPSCIRKNTLPFVHVKDSDFKKRLVILLQRTATWKKISMSAASVLLAIVFSAVSYTFILEASYQPPYFDEIFAEPSPMNAYFIVTDDLSYELYVNGEYFDTAVNLENYPSGIKIYDKEGVLLNED